MRGNRLLAFLAFMVAGQMAAAQETVVMESIPETVEEFIALRDTLGTTPEGGAALTIIAMIRYTENPVVGMTFFIVMLNNDGTQHRSVKTGGYKGQEPSAGNQMLINELADAPWIALSYLAGTTPENGYRRPSPPWTILVERRPGSDQSDGSVKLFITSSGADSARPLRLKKNDRGIWKIAEFSSLFVDVRKPPKQGDDL